MGGEGLTCARWPLRRCLRDMLGARAALGRHPVGRIGPVLRHIPAGAEFPGCTPLASPVTLGKVSSISVYSFIRG